MASPAQRTLLRPGTGSRTAAAVLNRHELVTICVAGNIVPATAKTATYRVGQDGGLRVLPGSGGITLSHRVGDACVGIAGDHVEPGVSLRSPIRGPGRLKDGPNRALNVLACVGNTARVTTGPACGARGVVTGKHGGVAHVMIDFPDRVLKRLRVGDTVQVEATGQGSRLDGFADVAVMNMGPSLLARWGVVVEHRRLIVPVTHCVPASIMGSGLGRASATHGDYDIQLFDPAVVARYRLASLRFGDMVAIQNAEGRFGRSYRAGQVTIGIVVHSDSTVAGHGPGVTTLLAGPAKRFVLRADRDANLAAMLGLRRPVAPRRQRTLIRKTPTRSATFVQTTAIGGRNGTP